MRESDTDTTDGHVQVGTPERTHAARGQAGHATSARVFRPSTVLSILMMLAICSASAAGGSPAFPDAGEPCAHGSRFVPKPAAEFQ